MTALFPGSHSRLCVTVKRLVMTKIIQIAGLSGAIAQLGERLPCTQEVSGSIPLGSTTLELEAESLKLKVKPAVI